VTDRRRSSRRDFLTSWFGGLRDASRAAVSGRPADPAKVLRPPGALTPDEAFLDACTRCGDCIPVCPVKAIITIEEADGRKLPAIDPAVTPCRLCDDLPCITACPDGALVRPEGGRSKVRIGIAKVDPRRCVTFRGELCTRCHKACPFPDKAIMMIGARPLVGSGACTGCGLCELACPERPKAITVVPERDLVPGLRVPRNEYTKPGGWMG
jgi:ferredoxin-type protein NapG